MNVHHRVAMGLSIIALVFTCSTTSAQDADHMAHHAKTGEPMSQQQALGCPMMGERMMGRMDQGRSTGMMKGGSAPGMASVFGSRVTPMINLSVDDVQSYLAAQLDRLNNKRLKIGDIKTDTGTVTAEIVTVDNSLVQRLKVDRHTGTIEYLD